MSVTYAHHLHSIGSRDVEIAAQLRFQISRGAFEKHPLTALCDGLFGDGIGELVASIDTFDLAGAGNVDSLEQRSNVPCRSERASRRGERRKP